MTAQTANTAKLTKRQQEELDNLRRETWLYVGYNSRPIMNVFDKLVAKGYAEVIEERVPYGKKYTATYDKTGDQADPRKSEDDMNIYELFTAAWLEKYSTIQLAARAQQLEDLAEIGPAQHNEFIKIINGFERPLMASPWARRPPTVTSS